jgi:hypothetical protein
MNVILSKTLKNNILKDNELIFSSNNDSVWIEFGNGKETLEYTCLEGALKMILDLYKQEKITEKERYIFTYRILTKGNLPVRTSKEEFTKLLKESTGGVLETRCSQIENPSFNICKCSAMPVHAYIFDDEGLPIKNKISTKNGGYLLIGKLLEHELITEESHLSLKVMIDASNLLEHSVYN